MQWVFLKRVEKDKNHALNRCDVFSKANIAVVYKSGYPATALVNDTDLSMQLCIVASDDTVVNKVSVGLWLFLLSGDWARRRYNDC